MPDASLSPDNRGSDAIVEVTGLRNPCVQIDGFQDGLLKHLVYHDATGTLIRKAGIMGVVTAGGEVRPGDSIVVELPPEPWRVMDRV